MKLFKNLLIAPAALGLLAPVTANANEVNLKDISNYSKFAVADVENIDHSSQDIIEFATSFNESQKPEILIAGGEGMAHSSDSFSSTTTASFSADFAIGAVEGTGLTSTVTDGNEALEAYYGFQIDLNTSFTGEDSLDISIDAGNSGGAATEFDLNGAVTDSAGDTTTDVLSVDGVSYTFPLAGATVMVGDNTDGSALFSTACVYGGPSNTLDDCGSVSAPITGGGTMIGASYEVFNNITIAGGYAGQGSSTSGLATQEGLDQYAVNVSYLGETYGLSASYARVEATTWTDDTFKGVNAYWAPEGFPSISVGYEWGHDGSQRDDIDDTTSYFVGLQFDEVGPGTLGAAVGTKTATIEGSDEQLMYEVFYSYPVNDGMTVTPLIFIKENTTAGTPDETGVLVKTSFSF